MAKTINTIGEFGTFKPEEKVNPYLDTMKTFAVASNENPETSWTVTLDAKRETPERVLIAEAAHAVNRTARLRNRDDSARELVGERKSGNPVYEGKVTLTFTLTDKHKARRGDK